MKRPLSLHHLTMLDAHPSELAAAAAHAGFEYVGLRIVSPEPGGEVVDLIGDLTARKAVGQQLRDTNVQLLDAEAIWLRESTAVPDLAPAMEAAKDLGARYFLTVGFDFDRTRLVDRLAQLADLAKEFELGITLEFITYSAIVDLADALNVVEATARDNVYLLIDSLQFFRSNSSLDLLASVSADRLPYVQISDAPRKAPSTIEDLRLEARSRRMIPGTGELDLPALLAALPPMIPVSVEAPTLQIAGLDRGEAALKLQQATRNLTSQYDSSK